MDQYDLLSCLQKNFIPRLHKYSKQNGFILYSITLLVIYFFTRKQIDHSTADRLTVKWLYCLD